MNTLYSKYASLDEFLNDMNSSRAIDFSAIIKAGAKLALLNYQSFNNLLQQLCGSDMTVEDFFDLAEENIDDDKEIEKYLELKNKVLASKITDIEDMVPGPTGVGFAINYPSITSSK